VVCRYDLAGGLEAVRELERRLLVRKLRARGATAQVIAGQVGCSTRTVWRLLAGFERATVIPPPVLERAAAAMARVAQIEVDRLLSEVAKDHGVTVAAVKSPLRRTNLVAARDDAVRRMRYGLGMKLMSIARALNRDHSTIIHSLRKGEG
jgi:chromosomal replication initiation ATPase DnaA